MHPATMLEVKKIVRESHLGQLTRFAKDVMKLRDTREIHVRVEKQSRH
jgi:phosphoenolpyruvate-protein kinase (PTS system EI component)